jgi:hypothetical protein
MDFNKNILETTRFELMRIFLYEGYRVKPSRLSSELFALTNFATKMFLDKLGMRSLPAQYLTHW